MKKPTPWLFTILFFSMVIVDQMVKAWIRATLRLEQSTNGPWPGVFEIRYTQNEGIAFGLLQGMGYLFAPVAILITLGAAWYCYRHPDEPRLLHAAWGLIASGAVGNLIDRVWMGSVTDMFWFRLINFPVFNVADACITIGAALLSCHMLFDRRHDVASESRSTKESNA